MQARWEDFVRSIYSKVFPIAAFIVVVMGVVSGLLHPILQRIEEAGMREALNVIMYFIALILVVLVLFAVYQIALSKDIKDILEERLPFFKSNPGEEKKEEKIVTSGAGALAGMVIGGTVGLIFGPLGVIVGGVIGAILGNQVEYENIRREKMKKKA